MRMLVPSRLRLTALLAPAAFLLMSVSAFAQMPVRNVFLGESGDLRGVAPLGATKVRLVSDADVQTIDVAADGTFAFAGPIEPGSYKLQFLNEDSKPLTDESGEFELNAFEANDSNAPEGTTELFDPTPVPGDPLEPGVEAGPPGGMPMAACCPPGGGSGGGGAGSGMGGWGWAAIAGLGGLAAWAADDDDDDDDDAPAPPFVSPIQ